MEDKLDNTIEVFEEVLEKYSEDKNAKIALEKVKSLKEKRKN